MSLKGLKYFLNKRGGWFFFLSSRGLLNWMDDEAYLKRVFKYSLGYELNLDDPKTFNEKLQWLKLHDRKPLYTQLVDKYAVKEYVAEKIGPEYVVPVVGGPWDSADEIDFDALPEQFVLKCTHDSGGVVICRDKAAFDREAAKAKLAKALKRNFYWANREWPYKDVKPRVFAERYMQNDGTSQELTDYKFCCFNGSAECVLACFDRASGDPKFYFFDRSWQLLRVNKRGLEAPDDFTVPKPDCIQEMFTLAERLSEGFPFLRVDLYESFGHIYFGELTLYPSGGVDPNYTPEADRRFGDLIPLNH